MTDLTQVFNDFVWRRTVNPLTEIFEEQRELMKECNRKLSDLSTICDSPTSTDAQIWVHLMWQHWCKISEHTARYVMNMIPIYKEEMHDFLMAVYSDVLKEDQEEFLRRLNLWNSLPITVSQFNPNIGIQEAIAQDLGYPNVIAMTQALFYDTTVAKDVVNAMCSPSPSSPLATIPLEERIDFFVDNNAFQPLPEPPVSASQEDQIAQQQDSQNQTQFLNESTVVETIEAIPKKTEILMLPAPETTALSDSQAPTPLVTEQDYQPLSNLELIQQIDKNPSFSAFKQSLPNIATINLSDLAKQCSNDDLEIDIDKYLVERQGNLDVGQIQILSWRCSKSSSPTWKVKIQLEKNGQVETLEDKQDVSDLELAETKKLLQLLATDEKAAEEYADQLRLAAQDFAAQQQDIQQPVPTTSPQQNSQQQSQSDESQLAIVTTEQQFQPMSSQELLQQIDNNPSFAAFRKNLPNLNPINLKEFEKQCSNNDLEINVDNFLLGNEGQFDMSQVQLLSWKCTSSASPTWKIKIQLDKNNQVQVLDERQGLNDLEVSQAKEDLLSILSTSNPEEYADKIRMSAQAEQTQALQNQ